MAYQQRQQERVLEATHGHTSSLARDMSAGSAGLRVSGASYRASSRHGSGSGGTPTWAGDQVPPADLVVPQSGGDDCPAGLPGRLTSDGSRRSTGSAPNRPSPLNPSRGPQRRSSRPVHRAGAGSSRSFPESGHEFDSSMRSLTSVAESESPQSSSRIHPTSYRHMHSDGGASPSLRQPNDAKAVPSPSSGQPTGDRKPLTPQVSLPGSSNDM